jgi:hypothetical protein
MKYPSASDGVMISIATFMSKIRVAPVDAEKRSEWRRMKALMLEKASSIGLKSGE